MAKFVWSDAHFTINAVDLSNRVKKLTLDIKVDEVEVTSMGSIDASGRLFKDFLSGFKDYSVEVEFFQDLAAASVDQTIYPMLYTLQPIVMRPNKTAVVGTSNPEYRATMAVVGYQPINAEIGNAAMAPLKLAASGTLTRNTT